MSQQKQKLHFPENEFYTLDDLIEKWDIKKDKILHYVVTGKLNLYVRSRGWWLDYNEEISEDTHGPHFMQVDKKYSRGQIFQLTEYCQEEIITIGKIKNPYFRYDSTSHDHTSFSRINDEEPNITIHLKDVIFTKEEIGKFEQQHCSNVSIVQANSERGYTTPYLELMKQIIADNNITNQNQGKHEQLEQSFKDAKLNGLHISGRLAKAMATLIRLPESQKGKSSK